jgi:hypothetical protein
MPPSYYVKVKVNRAKKIIMLVAHIIDIVSTVENAGHPAKRYWLLECFRPPTVPCQIIPYYRLRRILRFG